MCVRVDLLHLPEVVLIDQRPSQARPGPGQTRPDQEWDQAATEVEGGREGKGSRARYGVTLIALPNIN